MSDLISRQAVVDVICDMHIGGKDGVANALPNTYGADLREIIEQIDSLPSADAQPVRHGRWEWTTSTAVEQHGTWLPYLKEGLTVKCSECGSRFDRPWHYCPNCGARMDGERND